MKKIKVAVTLFFTLLTTLALTIGVVSAGAHCAIVFHQPKVPQGMDKFKKR
jgi:cyclic lactone autoinducer peptide